MPMLRRWRQFVRLDERRRDELQAHEPETAEQAARRSAASAMVWSCVGLFFLPFVNGLVGGILAAYRVGSARAALSIEIVPVLAWGTAITLAIGLPFTSLAGYLALLPGLWGFFTGAGLLLGIVIGGAIARGVHHPVVSERRRA